MDQEVMLDFLIDYLQTENPQAHIPLDDTNTLEGKIALFRGLCNIRQPLPVPDAFLEVQDAFLNEWNRSRRITSVDHLKPTLPQLYIWQGDITTLVVDGIVNAANSELLGCKLPNHHCIDNIIHTRSGVQLRLDCAHLMKKQGLGEPVGKAKITKAYNLPADYVIHTVGPFVDERGVSPLQEKLLAASYHSCLTLADENNLQSLAFCCISTGEFNFPNERAAEIAISTVKEYMDRTQSTLKIVFNVFTNTDLHIYESLLK